METPSNLRCLLITVQGGQAILPNSLVVEVLPFATPLGIENAPHWVIGAILWRNLTTPLVSLGRLIFQVPPAEDTHSRIIIVNALDADSRLPYFGILGTAPPRPINLQRSDLQAIDTVSAADSRLPVLRWVHYQDELTIIPDLEAIEAALKPLVRRA